MIDVFFRGGMPVAAKNLLMAVVDDYREETDKLYRVGMKYLIEVMLPKVKGRDTGAMSLDAQMMLFSGEIEMEWSEWLMYFPGTSIEYFEDKAGGKTGVLSKERLMSLTLDQFLENKAGLFYSPNGFFDEVQEGKKRRRNQSNIKHVNAFFIDLDGAPTEDEKDIHRKAIAEANIAPSFVVETRNGFHVLWLLEGTNGLESSVRWKNIQKGLIRHFKSDRACSDVSRLLRMPNSWHCKGLWTGGEAFKVKLVYQSPARYTMDDFAAFETKEKIREVTEMTAGELVLPEVTALAAGDRHASLKEETARAYAIIGSSVELAPQVRQGMKDWYSASCTELKPYWEKEVDEYCDWVESNQFSK